MRPSQNRRDVTGGDGLLQLPIAVSVVIMRHRCRFSHLDANDGETLHYRSARSERKADTRRKVIAGALALEHFVANRNSEFARILFRLLDEYVVRPHDRGLFEFLSPPDLLTPISEFTNAGRETAASAAPPDDGPTRK